MPQQKLRQTSLFFASNGDLLARYDKIHLFNAQIEDNIGRYRESDTFEAGDRLVIAPVEFGDQRFNLGMMICFDLRFPAMAQRLRQMGADLIAAPSAFTFLTGQAHWSILLQARALDSQCLVIGAAQGGIHHYTTGNRHTWGHASIARADGKIVAEYPHSALVPALSLTDPSLEQKQPESLDYALILAEFDAVAQNQFRRQIPLLHSHRLA